MWSNQVTILLGTQAIEVRSPKGIIEKIACEKTSIEKTNHDNITAENFAWRPALQALRAALHKQKLSKNTKLSIILATDMARYLCLPAQNIGMNNVEKITYVQAMFQEVYGHETVGWHIKIDDAPAHKNIIAYAIDQHLLFALEAQAEELQFNLVNITPYFAEVYNRLSPKIPEKNYLLCTIEANRIMMLEIKSNELLKIKTQPIRSGDDWETALQEVLAREKLLNNTEHNQLCLVSTLNAAISADLTLGWQKILPKSVRNLSGFSILENP